ncbi:hypothetical protein [Yersinia intermedia]|uniref:hypothetical protein n=1 Tax=Yersinia intermedia TaxID=631 RepID=UPI0020168578|nr:hypothetical protein [Yersinia intermedia]
MLNFVNNVFELLLVMNNGLLAVLDECCTTFGMSQKMQCLRTSLNCQLPFMNSLIKDLLLGLDLIRNFRTAKEPTVFKRRQFVASSSNISQ